MLALAACVPAWQRPPEWRERSEAHLHVVPCREPLALPGVPRVFVLGGTREVQLRLASLVTVPGGEALVVAKDEGASGAVEASWWSSTGVCRWRALLPGGRVPFAAPSDGGRAWLALGEGEDRVVTEVDANGDEGRAAWLPPFPDALATSSGRLFAVTHQAVPPFEHALWRLDPEPVKLGTLPPGRASSEGWEVALAPGDAGFAALQFARAGLAEGDVTLTVLAPDGRALAQAKLADAPVEWAALAVAPGGGWVVALASDAARAFDILRLDAGARVTWRRRIPGGTAVSLGLSELHAEGEAVTFLAWRKDADRQWLPSRVTLASPGTPASPVTEVALDALTPGAAWLAGTLSTRALVAGQRVEVDAWTEAIEAGCNADAECWPARVEERRSSAIYLLPPKR